MSLEDRPRTRRELLIDGRRVRLADLIEASLLKPGQELFYQQRVGMEPFRSVLTERGRLRLDDGREFSSPSAAATALAEVTAVAGWSAWRVGRDGPYLYRLRQELLKEVADEVSRAASTAEPEADAATQRFALLNDARSAADSGEPRTLTVQEMLKLWGAEDRDRSTSMQIESDLANHGLTTVPDFRAVSLDHVVRIVAPAAEAPTIPAATSLEESSSPSARLASEEVSVDIGLTLGNLLSGTRRLAAVSPSATFEEAVTTMQLNDYSQLAVLATPRKLHGAVSWKSIAEARHLKPDAKFSDAVDRNVQVFGYGTRLLDVLDVLQRDGFIFVSDFDNTINGIITTADVVQKYDETATPFFLIGEVDQELRLLIQNTFDEETARQACTAAKIGFKTFHEMTMGQYQAVLDNPSCWAQLGWPLDRKTFIQRLDQIRRVRNTVMHFNPDPVRAEDVAILRNFLNLIRRYNG
ncbi:CBS domain-containing protein [Catellatospora methionotrophica]|uniref:restriction system modified-DNA reader domain-containing protein n=1 Tax=Catellatospora methionotrophica TaxID=121620 RepID=UPI0033EBFC08